MDNSTDIRKKEITPEMAKDSDRSLAPGAKPTGKLNDKNTTMQYTTKAINKGKLGGLKTH